MIYRDRIYGEFEIKEPVIIAILESQALQRLKGILQHGITGMIGICSQSSRYEHSVGVMRLVQLLGGSLKEQIAALVHDISHTAFSHVVDHVFELAETQSFHEDKKSWFFQRSDIPEILDRFGFYWQDFLVEDPFQILEQPAPALCADRMDYLLRDTIDLNLLQPGEVQSIIQSLSLFEGKMVCSDINMALKMATVYMKADEKSWSNFREVGLYEITAQGIKRAIEIKLIQERDLWQTDEWLFQKLKSSKDKTLEQIVKLISPDTKFKWQDTKPTFRIKTKIRVIDPDVLKGDKTIKLSDLDANYQQVMLQYIQNREKALPIFVIGYPKA